MRLQPLGRGLAACVLCAVVGFIGFGGLEGLYLVCLITGFIAGKAKAAMIACHSHLAGAVCRHRVRFPRRQVLGLRPGGSGCDWRRRGCFVGGRAGVVSNCRCLADRSAQARPVCISEHRLGLSAVEHLFTDQILEGLRRILHSIPHDAVGHPPPELADWDEHHGDHSADSRRRNLAMDSPSPPAEAASCGIAPAVCAPGVHGALTTSARPSGKQGPESRHRDPSVANR